MTGGRGEVERIVCFDCTDVVLAMRFASGAVYVVVPGSEWFKGRVVVTCPECHREIKIRLHDAKEAA